MMKKCVIVFLAGVLLNPSEMIGADFTVFDQFADAFDTGLFQGVQISSELILESSNDSNSTQGVNVIATSYFNGRAVQVAAVEYDVSLMMSGGENVVQGINVYRGGADEISQMAIINGIVTLYSQNNTGGIQGINIITNCDSCN